MALDGAELHAVHAHQEYDAITLEHLGVDVDGIEERSLALRRQGLDRLLANLLVAETRTGIPGLLIGNTAEKILDGVACDVLAIKPEGFVTPVTLTDSE